MGTRRSSSAWSSSPTTTSSRSGPTGYRSEEARGPQIWATPASQKVGIPGDAETGGRQVIQEREGDRRKGGTTQEIRGEKKKSKRVSSQGDQGTAKEAAVTPLKLSDVTGTSGSGASVTSRATEIHVIADGKEEGEKKEQSRPTVEEKEEEKKRNRKRTQTEEKIEGKKEIGATAEAEATTVNDRSNADQQHRKTPTHEEDDDTAATPAAAETTAAAHTDDALAAETGLHQLIC